MSDAPRPAERPTERLGGPPQGAGLLRAGLAVVAAFVVVVGGWITWAALANPDVRLKRPRWLDAERAFDGSYWTPLWLTAVVGALLVGWVFWRAARRVRAGEDLFEQRMGRGLRRRGERYSDPHNATEQDGHVPGESGP